MSKNKTKRQTPLEKGSKFWLELKCLREGTISSFKEQIQGINSQMFILIPSNGEIAFNYPASQRSLLMFS